MRTIVDQAIPEFEALKEATDHFEDDIPLPIVLSLGLRMS